MTWKIFVQLTICHYSPLGIVLDEYHQPAIGEFVKVINRLIVSVPVHQCTCTWGKSARRRVYHMAENLLGGLRRCGETDAGHLEN